MSNFTASSNRWLNWKPKAQIFLNMAEGEPTKPSKPGFVGFDGAIPAKSSNIEGVLDAAEFVHASTMLNQVGIRIMTLEGGTAIGVWSDLDSAEVREALRIFGLDRLPLRYLDGIGVPTQYKFRCVGGEPVPLNVLVAMCDNPAEPWKIRDRMLNEMKLKTYTKGTKTLLSRTQ